MEGGEQVGGSKKERSDEEAYQFDMVNYKNLYTLEKWYTDTTKHLTSRTLFLDLGVKEARALVNLYEKENNKSQNYSDEDQLALDQYKQFLDAKMREEFGDKGAFAKLSSRSPKDVLMESDKIATIFKTNLKSITNIEDSNEQLIIYINSLIQSGCFQSGEEIISIFSKSERIYVDLTRWLQFSEDLGPMYVTLREFNQQLRAHMEFRGFVHKKQLNAVTQYYDTVCFDLLLKNEQQYKTAILNYFNQLNSSSFINMDNYIIDFLCYDDFNIQIIEINPWASTTGASLFSWSADRQVLMNGPYEFRILKAPIPDIHKQLFPKIQKIIQEAKEEYKAAHPDDGICLLQ
eukprot:TRINITY_DN9120_c0_g1_i1.p1 TRINITY_DN9120_c0_g1~~TRINITY_DN9120_c0_g1_i1.p1  ORF type:complete len:347 (-),score=110.14 TRINITY_DN9120_c0_g1_i1:18-1058(-)